MHGYCTAHDGLRLHYTVQGQGSPLLLLHGLAVSADLNWRYCGWLHRLTRKHRVISLDLRGHGRSDRPHRVDQYGLELVQDVVALLDHLQIDRAAIAGYSLGGFITLKTSALYPQRVSRAALLASGWIDPADDVLFRNLDQWADDLLAGRPYRSVLASITGATEKPGRFEVWIEHQFVRHLNDVQALSALVKSLRSLTVDATEIAQLDMPLCVITGSIDPLAPAARALASQAPCAEYHKLAGVGHISLACRKKARTLLTEWLTTPSKGGALGACG